MPNNITMNSDDETPFIRTLTVIQQVAFIFY